MLINDRAERSDGSTQLVLLRFSNFKTVFRTELVGELFEHGFAVSWLSLLRSPVQNPLQHRRCCRCSWRCRPCQRCGLTKEMCAQLIESHAGAGGNLARAKAFQPELEFRKCKKAALTAALIDPSSHHLQLMMVPFFKKGLVQRLPRSPTTFAASCLAAHQMLEMLPVYVAQGQVVA